MATRNVGGIGAGRISRTNQNLANAKTEAAKKRQLNQDVNKGARTAASTVGAQSNKPKSNAETVKEKVTLSTPRAEKAEEAVVQEQPKAPAEASQETKDASKAAKDSLVQLDTPSGGSSKSETTVKAEEGLMNALGEVTVEDNNKIAQSASSMIAETPGAPPENVLAIAAHRHSIETLRTKLGLSADAKPKDIRKAAKGKPELAADVMLFDNSLSMIRSAMKDKKANQAAGAAGTAGSNAAVASAQQGGDPIAQMKSEAGQVPPQDGGQQPPGGGVPPQDGQQPPGPPQPPQDGYHLDPSQQMAMMNQSREQMAQMQADNMKTNQAIANIWAEMMAENRKAMAQRHKLMMDTATSIRQMVSDSHFNQMRAMDQHHQKMTQVILGSYGP